MAPIRCHVGFGRFGPVGQGFPGPASSAGGEYPELWDPRIYHTLSSIGYQDRMTVKRKGQRIRVVK